MVYVKNEFGAWDYVVFAAMLVISMAIGIYFALRGGKQKTQGEYLMADRSMSVLPVAISILVSFMSAILILGTPAEMYTQGTEFYVSILGTATGILLAVLLFVPLLFPLKLTSAFEYLERRFNSRGPRLVGTFLMVLSQILYMGIASYAPSTALEAVTGFPVWATILITGVVATFYTSIGGMKAVIWTDVFQAMVMLAGILAILIQGVVKVGGMGRVWDIANKWQRIKFFNFNPDPTVRHTTWSLVIGSAMAWLGTYGLNQASVQRYSSLPTLTQARLSVLLNLLGVFSLITLTCLAGVVMFAYYADEQCDPLGHGLVENANQLVPYFVMETLSYPGVPGLFIASLFSGALSSVSSSLNSLAAITWEDVMKPTFDRKWSEGKKTVATKALVVMYGVLAIIMSFVSQQLEGTVLQAAISLIGAAAGPMTGMFMLGAFFPWANSIGAIVGALVGLGISMWLSVGAYVTGIPLKPLSFPNGTCPVYGPVTMTTPITTTTTTITVASLATIAAEHGGRQGIEKFYGISYMWFTCIGIISCIVVGLLVSFITGANSTDDVPTKYQIPFFSRLFCCLPQSVQYTLNCKRHFVHPEDIRAEEKDAEITIEPQENGESFALDNRGFESDKHEMSEKGETKNGIPLAIIHNGDLYKDQSSSEGHSQGHAPPDYETATSEQTKGDNNNSDLIVEKF